MSKLYLVPTPIGNLRDITLRALDVLKEVDLVLAEDTRQTRKLFQHYGISTHLESFHMHNEHKRVDSVVEKIAGGVSIAIVSDAGTPGISDPGFLLVRECIKQNIAIDCLPGATALIPAIVNSGLPCDKFIFDGFLPHKKGKQTKLKQIAEETRTTIVYESPHRILKSLAMLAEFCDENRQISVSREITKLHEETVRGTIQEVITYFETHTLKGEFVLVISGKE